MQIRVPLQHVLDICDPSLSWPWACPAPYMPVDAYRWNKALRGAFRRGAIAHRDGLPQSACPYGDKRKPDGRLSWSRSFISAWQDGWRWSENGKAW